MKYILAITAFCEPDNNTPISRTDIKIIKADNMVKALELAEDTERQFIEGEEVVDVNIKVLDYEEDMFITVGETWG